MVLGLRDRVTIVPASIKKILISQEYSKRFGKKRFQFIRGTFDFIKDFATSIKNSCNIFHVSIHGAKPVQFNP
jgi:hypothetical protein